MEEDSKRDAMGAYVSVYEAMGTVSDNGTKLGTVINGATVRRYGSDKAGDDYEPTELSDWGYTMGALYEKLTAYTAFAVGGQECYSYTYDGSKTTTQLQVVNKDGKVVKSWLLNTALPVGELLPYCTTAGYGDLKTQTTVVDDTVRAAMELPSDAFTKLHGGVAAKPGFTFRLVGVKLAAAAYSGAPVQVHPASDATIPAPPDFVACIHTAVREKLVRTDFTLVPYKLNVYGKDGFFKPHVDTPTVHSARMVGTVVVALPSAFEGGALTVRAPSGTSPTLIAGPAAAAAGGGGGGGAGGGGAAAAASGGGTGSSSGVGAAAKRGRDGKALGAAAPPVAPVDGDEEVSVYSCKWGPHSVSTDLVQWAAFFGDCVHEVEPVTAGHRVTITYAIVLADGATDDDTKVVSAPHVARMVDHVAACPVSTCGILLTHKYTFTGIASATLKGMDRVVYDALVRAGLRVTLRPVVYNMYITWHPSIDDGHSYGDVSNVVYSFCAAEVARLCRGVRADTPASNIPFVRCSADTYGRLRADEPVGQLLQRTYSEAYGFTGNESHPESTDELYFAAALMVSK